MNKSSNASRLGGFAAAHFGLSLLCWIVMMSSGLFWHLTSLEENMAASLVFMVLYFPAGTLMSAVAPWARVSTLRELGRAVVTQAGIAWVWGWMVLMAIFVPGTLALLVWLVFPTFILAAPSSLFVLSTVGAFAGDLLEPDSFLIWLAAMLAAGLLPPLLYNLGNFCVSRNVRPCADLQGSPEAPSGRELSPEATEGESPQ